jgi:hypothetical protein
LQQHLITILLARPEFSTEQIDSSKLSEVQQRLIHCNLKRRNRFLYAQQHSKSLDTDPARRLSQAQSIKTTGNCLANDGESAMEKRKPVSDTLTSQQALTPTPATSTIMSSTMIDLRYPHPPRRKEGAHVFMCPCCCKVLPVTLSEGNRWK